MSARSSGDRAPDRRRFLKLVGFAGLSSAVSDAMTTWAAPAPSRSKKTVATPPPPPDTTGQGARTAADVAAEGQDLLAIVQRRYGKHLEPAQIAGVKQELEGRIQQGKRLRAAKLVNSDEPDFVFKA